MLRDSKRCACRIVVEIMAVIVPLVLEDAANMLNSLSIQGPRMCVHIEKLIEAQQRFLRAILELIPRRWQVKTRTLIKRSSSLFVVLERAISR